MNDISPIALPAQVLKAPTLADLIARIEADEDLSPTRQRDMASAVRRVAALIGQSEDLVEADHRSLKAHLAQMHPSRYGLSQKTWANLRSNLLGVLNRYRLVRTVPASTKLNDDWTAVWDKIAGKRLRNGLSRFCKYASERGLAPGQIDDRVMAEFHEYLIDHTSVDKANDRHRLVCRLWNEIVPRLPGGRTVSLPDYRRRHRLALADFPASFAADLEAYLEAKRQARVADLFDVERPMSSLKPSTLRLRSEQIRLAAAALVSRGRAVDSVKALADLVKPEAFKEILRQLLIDHEQKANAWMEGVAKTLIAIAKEWVEFDDAQLRVLRDLMSRLPPREPGMTSKNRKTLRQFDGEVTLGRLLDLPDQLFAEACRIEPATERAATKAQLALAIRLLLCCPIRSHNLIALRLGEHILRPGGPRGPVLLCIEPHETKNDQRVDFELPARLVRMLDEYLARFQPVLGGVGCPFLFPAAGGKCKKRGTLAQQIKERLAKRLGITMTIHQFRHLAAKIFLQAHPGNFEALRRLLHHKSIRTTMQAYAEFDTRQAGKLHDQVLEQRFDEFAAKLRRGSAQKGKR